MSDSRWIGDELWGLHERLQRILASGWRNAASDAQAMLGEAEELEDAGLSNVAERVRAVATAGAASEALSAVALASAACQLVLARLPGDAAGADWVPLARGKRPAAAESLLPIARVPLDGRETWACARLRGAAAGGLVLIEPHEAPPGGGEGRAKKAAARGLAARMGLGRGSEEHAAPAIWLRGTLRGPMRWLARHPLGAEGELQVCDGHELEWCSPGEADPTDRFFEQLAKGKLADGLPVIGWGGPLQVKELRSEAAADYAWLDPTAAAAFGGLPAGPLWAIAWAPKGLIAPLAVVTPPGLTKPARLTHLVVGRPGSFMS